MAVLKPLQLGFVLCLFLIGCQKQDTCKTASNAQNTPPSTVTEPQQCEPELMPPVTGNNPSTEQKQGVVKVSTFDDFATKLYKDTNKVAVLVIGSATNCSACKTVDGYLPSVASRHSGRATYYLADPYQAPEFMEFVTSIPTFFVLTHYQENWDVVDGWEGAKDQSFVENKVASYFTGRMARMISPAKNNQNTRSRSQLASIPLLQFAIGE